LSLPDSTSLFAGLSFVGFDTARGIVEVSRSVARPSRDCVGDGNVRGAWSICEESQLSPAGIGVEAGDDGGRDGIGCGIGGVCPDLRACSSHACRVLSSTGHTSAVFAGDATACAGSLGTPSRSTLALAPIFKDELMSSSHTRCYRIFMMSLSMHRMAYKVHDDGNQIVDPGFRRLLSLPSLVCTSGLNNGP
jgi:hypothetical protein